MDNPVGPPIPVTLPTLSQPQTVKLPDSPRKSGLPLLLIILLLLALTATSLLAYQNWQLNQRLSTLTSTTTPSEANPSEARSDSVDAEGDTATWKTYTSEKFGFSFKYPDSYFKYLKDFPDIGVYLAPSQGNMEGPAGLEPNDVWIDVSIQSGANVKSLDQFIALQGQGQMYINTQGKSPVLIGGVQGYKITRRFVDGNIPVANYEGLVLKDEVLYHVILSAHTEEVLVKNEQLFDQILSTFRFTN